MDQRIPMNVPILGGGGASRISVQHHQFPSANPAIIVEHRGQEVAVNVIGGLSKLEWMAGMVASRGPMSADYVVDAACHILAECHRRQTAPPEPDNGEPH